MYSCVCVHLCSLCECGRVCVCVFPFHLPSTFLCLNFRLFSVTEKNSGKIFDSFVEPTERHFWYLGLYHTLSLSHTCARKLTHTHTHSHTHPHTHTHSIRVSRLLKEQIQTMSLRLFNKPENSSSLSDSNEQE